MALVVVLALIFLVVQLPGLTLLQILFVLSIIVLALLTVFGLVYIWVEKSGSKQMAESVARLEALFTGSRSAFVQLDVYLHTKKVYESIWVAGASLEIERFFEPMGAQLKRDIEFRLLCVDEDILPDNIRNFVSWLWSRGIRWRTNQLRIRRLSEGHFPMTVVLYDANAENAEAVIYFPHKSHFRKDKYRVGLVVTEAATVREHFRDKFLELWKEAREEELADEAGNIDLQKIASLT